MENAEAIRLHAQSALKALDGANVFLAQTELHMILNLCPNTEANHPNLGKVLLSPDEIYHMVQALGQRISADYPNGVHLIGILYASNKFVNDLAKHIIPPCSVGAIDLARPDGMVTPTKPVILCDTICDTGATLLEAKKRFPEAKTCVLINKVSPKRIFFLNYSSFTCAAPLYPVGYGLDHAQAFRSLSYIVEYLNPTQLRSRRE